jgi:hypothetical protein
MLLSMNSNTVTFFTESLAPIFGTVELSVQGTRKQLATQEGLTPPCPKAKSYVTEVLNPPCISSICRSYAVFPVV